MKKELTPAEQKAVMDEVFQKNPRPERMTIVELAEYKRAVNARFKEVLARHERGDDE